MESKASRLQKWGKECQTKERGSRLSGCDLESDHVGPEEGKARVGCEKAGTGQSSLSRARGLQAGAGIRTS